MPSKKSPPLRLIAAAAELRAGGASWDAVATQVGRSVETVRRWPVAYPAIWRKAARIAERQLLTDATAESVHTLRRQLRSEDDKASRDAAQKLIQFRVADGKRGRPKRTAKRPAAASDFVRVAAYLETLTHDQLDQLIAALDAEATDPMARQAPPPPGERDHVA